MENLKYINLESNFIRAFSISEYLPSSILTIRINKNIMNFTSDKSIAFSSLELYDLSYNLLTDLDFKNVLDGFKKLKYFYLNNNFLQNIETENFNSMPDLRVLDLNFNLINFIESGAFNSLQNLEKLSIAFNKIQNLNKETFMNLEQLKYLNLSFNLLDYLEDGLFNDLLSLKELDLSSNCLKYIQNYLFKNQINLLALHLQSNLDLTFNFKSLSSLILIKNIYVSYETLTNKDNRIFISKFLDLTINRNLNGVIFYNSINILMDNVQVDCNLTLFFIRKNIHLNFKNDHDFTNFWKNCHLFNFKDLKL